MRINISEETISNIPGKMVKLELSCDYCFGKSEKRLITSIGETGMKKVILLSVVLVLVIISGAFFQMMKFPTAPERKDCPAEPLTVRRIDSGRIIGTTEQNGSHAWFGIPYARPPVGNLRWKAPVDPGKWKGLRQMVSTGPVCTQIGGLLGNVPPSHFDKPTGREDCLCLNVWAPPFIPTQIPRGRSSLPVMVWIHGGGNSIGHGGSYIGKDLAVEHDVIVVTLNYRLGPLGWFTHPALREEGLTREDISGNYGLLDIIKALKWVRKNIAGFGGDPHNVTVFGESAGGRNALTLMLSPLAKELFHNVIVQSGVLSTAPLHEAENYRDADLPGHQYSSREVINQLLIRDKRATDREGAKKIQQNMSPDEIREYLFEKGPFELLRAYQTWAGGMLFFPQDFRDGYVLPQGDPVERFSRAGEYNAVPVILGTNRDEYKLFMLEDPRFVEKYFGLYRTIRDIEVYNRVAKYRSDAWKAQSVDQIADSLYQSGKKPVYTYRFDWDEEPTILGLNVGTLLGAAHGVEIPFVFGNRESGFTSGFTVSDENREGIASLSKAMMSYWTQFARAGSPGRGHAGNQPLWKPWPGSNSQAEKLLVIDTEKDGGIRMSLYSISLREIKKQLISDNTFENQEMHCLTYREIFRETELWNENEYETLGKSGCQDIINPN